MDSQYQKSEGHSTYQALWAKPELYSLLPRNKATATIKGFKKGIRAYPLRWQKHIVLSAYIKATAPLLA